MRTIDKNADSDVPHRDDVTAANAGKPADKPIARNGRLGKVWINRMFPGAKADNREGNQQGVW
jgi:hypothetical protein